MTIDERTELIRRRMITAIKLSKTDTSEIAWKLGLRKDRVQLYLYAGIPRTAALLAEIILGLGVSASWLLGTDRKEED